MAARVQSIFEMMKKYELPTPLWCYKPELEQDSWQWSGLGASMAVRRVKRFLGVHTPHDRALHQTLFPLPFDWDDWLPKQEETDSGAFIEKRQLRLRRWTPEVPGPEEVPEEEYLKIFPGERTCGLSFVHWESFLVKMQRGNRFSTELYSPEHLLLMGYALYRGDLRLYTRLQESDPDCNVWQKTLGAALKCRTPDWLELLPHLLGVGLYRLFTENPYLQRELQETGDRPIVYVDPHHEILGGSFREGKLCGENLYGKTLMQVRSEIRRVYDNLVLCMGIQEETSGDVFGEPFDMPF